MDIRIPNLGEGADSGSIVNIFVKEGDTVAKDQTLVELENEKAVAPIPSTHSGVVQKIYVKVGDKVSVGQAILSLKEEAASGAAPAQPEAPSPQKESPQETPAQEKSSSAQAPSKPAPPPPSGFPPPASPTIRKMASELGIDLTRVRGSEAGGRIILSDLKAYIQQLQQGVSGAGSSAKGAPAVQPKAPEPSIDFSQWGPVKKISLSSLRQKIGAKMTEAWTTIPHVTQFDEADITSLMVLRKKYVPAYEKKGTKLTLTPFVIKAIVAALKKYPNFNSSLEPASHELILKDYYHIGVAVDTEAGLIVPVLRDADKKSLFEISKNLETLAEKTRQRKISADELKGGTFTLSNLGSIGGTFFTPIINKPEVAILGTGRGYSKGKKLVLPLGLSYDHRAVDGADGARFIRALVETLENFPEKEAKL